MLVSAALLAVGLFAIISALGDDGAGLPSEGSLQEILGDAPTAAPAAPPTPSRPPAPAPVRFLIPRLYIDAPVVTLGLDSNRYPAVPDRPDQVAWYNFSAAPGQNDNAVFAGHVDWQTRRGDPIPGVFYRLREMKIGDQVTVSLEDGAQLQYRVTGNVATAYNDPNVLRAMGSSSKDVITLITCGGAWVIDPKELYGGNYTHRIIVRAERVSDAVQGDLSSTG
jgi:LPXTG-site transpeptidase (sortase) family protein